MSSNQSLGNTPPTICPLCGNSIKYIPAGVSKNSGKPYPEFWACSERECKFTWKPTNPVMSNANIDDSRQKTISLLEEMVELLKNIDAKMSKTEEEL